MHLENAIAPKSGRSRVTLTRKPKNRKNEKEF
jgi:hypothetical protein